ncbi:MAG: hypothetical protein PHV20_06880 [Bacteroidales bacterium]|nr:hypothetical protein [Bacteroidales bacterium]
MKTTNNTTAKIEEMTFSAMKQVNGGQYIEIIIDGTIYRIKI